MNVSAVGPPVCSTALTRHAGCNVPLICGAMYPCSNPELVAAASRAGAIGIIQPITLTFVYGHEFRAGLRLIRAMTSRPIGMNALIEQSSRRYTERMSRWIDIALEEGVRFFITSLGKPDWVVRRVHAVGGIVYHDVTDRKWAEKGLAAGVDGLIAVNCRAGGHAGRKDARTLWEELHSLGVPLVCAGGVGTEQDFVGALRMGYAGVQMGTRFIATPECHVSADYKAAIVAASENDIVMNERLTGIPVALIRTPYVERTGLHAGFLGRWMLRGRRTKRIMRTIYALRAMRQLRRVAVNATSASEYWQAGKSVSGIDAVQPVDDIVGRFGRAAAAAQASGMISA
ncbi:MAG: NAD(P)H-dependent flavin oxidoreductase [Acidiferrobacterales bacterium]